MFQILTVFRYIFPFSGCCITFIIDLFHLTYLWRRCHKMSIFIQFSDRYKIGKYNIYLSLMWISVCFCVSWKRIYLFPWNYRYSSEYSQNPVRCDEYKLFVFCVQVPPVLLDRPAPPAPPDSSRRSPRKSLKEELFPELSHSKTPKLWPRYIFVYLKCDIIAG